MQNILKYFPDLSPQQIEQFQQLGPLYTDWNSKINVISRKDIEHLYTKHVLHSLVIAKFCPFKPGAEILDLGTGGGFPGIPLAILYPETKFTLIDGTGKKIKVVKDIAEQLGLQNVEALQMRAEEFKKRKFDFVVSRAVAAVDQLFMWSQKFFKQDHHHVYPNGLICLKGGDIKKEMKTLPKGEFGEYDPINRFFEEPYFEEKYVVYVQG